jgi:transitional endoplasmic reticulum ATPase
MPLAKSVGLEVLAGKTHGFVGADLSSLAKEAAMQVLRKVLPEMSLEDTKAIPQEILDKMSIEGVDFDEALRVVRPSAMREVLVEAPNVSWEDIGGLHITKQELREAVELPITHPDSFKRLGIRPPRGVLLYGPPGTGKTLLAKAVAKESEANFIQVKGPSLLSMWVGKSEEGVRKVFERARQVAPCVIFFDELDALASRRGVETGTKVTERVLNQLLAEMDGLEGLKDVTIIAATNRPDMLDPALLRPGRFDRIILVDVPDAASRASIFKVHLKQTPLAPDVSVDELVKQTEGFVGADIEGLVREAAMYALRKNPGTALVAQADFDAAFTKVRPSVSPETAKRYKKLEDYYLKAAKAGLDVGPMYAG